MLADELQVAGKMAFCRSRATGGGGQQTLRGLQEVTGPPQVMDEVARHGGLRGVLAPQSRRPGQGGQEPVEVAGGGGAVGRRSCRRHPEPRPGGVEELVQRRHHRSRTAASARAAMTVCSAASPSWTPVQRGR
ncbi:hypothetical protein [Streptomyces sp. NBC_00059]|uniref:hypothetical protein n=1 Tax=Streptomyces sp. NBC_00059 TaxID=2975635 RepID=UPI00224D37FC|nr:hypothetical protein [Streptomyces sp. NBC_00059]MCX5416344.1 hypothetical protein [Streptomyces sp. NBC_00059]